MEHVDVLTRDRGTPRDLSLVWLHGAQCVRWAVRRWLPLDESHADPVQPVRDVRPPDAHGTGPARHRRGVLDRRGRTGTRGGAAAPAAAPPDPRVTWL